MVREMVEKAKENMRLFFPSWSRRDHATGEGGTEGIEAS